MSPDDVKEIFDRMTRLSYYGYAKARVKGHKGVYFLRFHFDEDPDTDKRTKLHKAFIVYKAWLRKRPDFYQRMMNLAQGKWGTAKNAGQVARKIITWVDEDKQAVVQWIRAGDHYELCYEP